MLYTNLLTSNNFIEYLVDIEKQAEDMFFRLVKQMAKGDGIIEQLKADNQMGTDEEHPYQSHRNHKYRFDLHLTDNGGKEKILAANFMAKLLNLL